MSRIISTRLRRSAIAGFVLLTALALAAALVGCTSQGDTSSTGTPTTVSGNVQRISVSAQGAFSPNVIRAQAGMPIELAFGQGSGCSAAIKFPPLGIAEDLSAGPKTVTLPALEPGRYTMYCQADMDMGVLIIE